MKIAVHSTGGDGLGLALRLQDEGHTVGIYMHEPQADVMGRGLIAHLTDFLVAADAADLVLFDQVGHGSLADRLRDDGIPVLGGSKFCDLLELDRAFAMRTFKAAGLRIPPTHEFRAGDFGGAMSLVERTQGRYVFKPAGNIGTEKTHVARDADDMLAFLEHAAATMAREEGHAPPFLLQEFVPGVEVSTERWYAHGQPVPGMDNSTLEEKKFLVGGLGPATGCAGNVVIPHADKRLLGATVARLDRLALEHQITGPVDLNAIVSERDHEPYILEATARFGYDAIFAFCALWKQPVADILLSLAENTAMAPTYTARMGAAVNVSVPPYPCGDPKTAAGTPVVDDILGDPQVWPGDVMLREDETLVIAGGDAIAYRVTGTGESPAAALGACYRWLDGCRLPDSQYRVDLAESLSDRLRRLQSWGYLRDRARVAA